MASMCLLTPHQLHLTQATHLFLTTQGTATMEGTALDDDDETPQARPTQAIWINTTTGTDNTVDPDPEWMAIHCTLDCTKDDPTLTEWQTRWAVTVTLTCHQHTWWLARWNATGTTDRVHTFTPAAKPVTPLALGDRFSHSTHHTNHPRAHWLALKTAMHWTVDAPATDTTLPETWLTLTCNLATYWRKYRTAQAQRWMSWPTDTERTLKLRTTSLQEHTNRLRGMHRPQEGQGPAYSIFRRDAPKPAPKPAPEHPQPKPRPLPGGGGRLSPQGQTAQTGAQSGPCAAATRSTTEAEGPSMPAFHTGGTCCHAPRMARRRRSTRSIRSHA